MNILLLQEHDSLSIFAYNCAINKICNEALEILNG